MREAKKPDGRSRPYAQKMMTAILSYLTPDQQHVIRCLYGLQTGKSEVDLGEVGKSYSIADTAAKLGMTSGRVNELQVQAKGLLYEKYV